MDEKNLFIILVIIGILSGSIGFYTITNSPTGAITANLQELYSSHSVCINGQCVEISGSGNNECIVNDHCYHLTCVRQQCTLIRYPGQNKCISNDDCAF